MFGFLMNTQFDNLEAEFIVIGLDKNNTKLFAKKATLFGSQDAQNFITYILNKNWKPILSSLDVTIPLESIHRLEIIDIKFGVSK